MRALAAALLCALCLFACSKPQPPVGRWEGTYDSADTMVIARLEIMPNGSIYVSAPDAENFAETDRATLHNKLAQQLNDLWGTVQPRQMEFDGHTFRKPGGVAPQMEWDADTRQMKLIVYLGMRSGLTIPLHGVKDFSVNPWVH